MWITHDSETTGMHLFKIQDSGSIDFVFQETEDTDWVYHAHNIKMDWTNELLITSSFTYPAWDTAQQVSLYDTSGSGANYWIYAEEVWYLYLQQHADFNDMVYFQCGKDYWDFDLQLLALQLDASAPHNIVNYGLVWLPTDVYAHHNCNGVHVVSSSEIYVLLRFDDGTMYALEVDLETATTLDFRLDGNFRMGGYESYYF